MRKRGARAITARARAAIAVVRHAFSPKQSCASSPSLRFLYIRDPATPLTPQQRAAIDRLRQVGWRVISSADYHLGMAEWDPE